MPALSWQGGSDLSVVCILLSLLENSFSVLTQISKLQAQLCEEEQGKAEPEAIPGALGPLTALRLIKSWSEWRERQSQETECFESDPFSNY